MKFLLFLLPFFLFSSDKFSIAPPPSWIKPIEYHLPLDTDQKPLENLLIHLVDVQTSWEDKTTYNHIVLQPLNSIGLEDASRMELNFNPAFSHVTIHSIRLYRNGIWYDRLLTARHHILQRENELDMQIYTGLLTLIYFISDVRVGDLVEYQYSIREENPILSTYIYEDFNLENELSIEKICYRLLAHPRHDIKVKPFFTPLVPHVQDITPDVREWSLCVEKTVAKEEEPHTPSSFTDCAHIQLSSYPSWEVVSQQLYPLVVLPPHFMEDPHPEILSLIKDWRDLDCYQRAEKATRFVQNEIQYLSLSDGISALKPEDPTVSFIRRYGDCKDKTFLLHGLLKLLRISSTPILISTTSGSLLPHVLPSPSAFNHMILRIDFEDQQIFVDPTLTQQAGSLKDSYVPCFYYGLPIVKENSHLVSIPEIKPTRPTEIESTVSIENDHSLLMSIETKYYEDSATGMRQIMDSMGYQELSKILLKKFRLYHPRASFAQSLRIVNDLSSKCFITKEYYHLPCKKGDTPSFKACPHRALYALPSEIDVDRKAPYAIPYPLWIREHIQVQLPSPKEKIYQDELIFNHDSLVIKTQFAREKEISDFYFEVEVLKDHILPSEFSHYNHILAEVEKCHFFK